MLYIFRVFYLLLITSLFLYCQANDRKKYFSPSKYYNQRLFLNISVFYVLKIKTNYIKKYSKTIFRKVPFLCIIFKNLNGLLLRIQCVKMTTFYLNLINIFLWLDMENLGLLIKIKKLSFPTEHTIKNVWGPNVLVIFRNVRNWRITALILIAIMLIFQFVEHSRNAQKSQKITFRPRKIDLLNCHFILLLIAHHFLCYLLLYNLSAILPKQIYCVLTHKIKMIVNFIYWHWHIHKKMKTSFILRWNAVFVLRHFQLFMDINLIICYISQIYIQIQIYIQYIV